MKKKIVMHIGQCLSVLAVVFAAVPCRGYLYEPKVPDKLRK